MQGPCAAAVSGEARNLHSKVVGYSRLIKCQSQFFSAVEISQIEDFQKCFVKQIEKDTTLTLY